MIKKKSPYVLSNLAMSFKKNYMCECSHVTKITIVDGEKKLTYLQWSEIKTGFEGRRPLGIAYIPF